MHADVFDKFLRLLDLYLDGIIHKEHMELSFAEEEWDELYVWIIALIDLVREHEGSIDKMIEEARRKAQENPKFKENLERALHLKQILDENPFRLSRFEEMVSYLETEWEDRIWLTHTNYGS